MNLSDFTLLKEDDNSYTVGHPEGKSIHVVKSGLSSKAQEVISKLKKAQNMDQGGAAAGPTEGDSVSVDLNYKPPFPPETPFPPNKTEATEPGSQPFGTPDPTAQPAVSPPAPTAVPPTATPTQAGVGYPDYSAPLKTEKATLQAGARAEGTEGKANAAAIADYQQKQADEQAAFKKRHQLLQDQDTKYQQWLADPKNAINANRLMQNMGTGSKITAGIAMLLGGLGGSPGNPNPAVGVINDAITRDIDAQKNAQGNVMNLYKMNRENMNSDIEANLATQNQMLGLVKMKMLGAAALAAGPEAAARIAPAVSGIDQQIQMNNFKRTAAGQIGSGQMSSADPENLVPLFIQNPDQQNKAYAEIKDAKKIRNLTPQIMAAFDAGSSRNPIEAAHGQREFEALMNTTVKDVEGTSKQPAFDSIHKNMTPSGITAGPGENEAKRRSVLEYLASQQAAPVIKGASNGIIDLSKFSKTAPWQPPSSFEGKTATNSQGQKIINRNGKWEIYGGQ